MPADEGIKVKEDKKIERYLDLAREQIKLWNMTVTLMLIVVEHLATVQKNGEKRLDEPEIRRTETVQTYLSLQG